MNYDTVDPDRNSVLMTMASLAEKNAMTADTLLAMIVMRLSSPRTAQKYLVETLYEGPMDDTAANAIRAFHLAGPLMMYVSDSVVCSVAVSPQDRRWRFRARSFTWKVAWGIHATSSAETQWCRTVRQWPARARRTVTVALQQMALARIWAALWTASKEVSQDTKVCPQFQLPSLPRCPSQSL